MQEIINKLIMVDKSARKKVEQAAARKADVINEIDKKRNEIKKRTQEEFLRISAENKQKAEQDFLGKYSDEKVDFYNKETLKQLDKYYEENRDRWVEEIFSSITG